MAKSSLFLSNLMKSLSSKDGCVIDLIFSTRGSILVPRACNHYLLAFQEDQGIFDCVLKPILDNASKYNVKGPRIKVVDDDVF